MASKITFINPPLTTLQRYGALSNAGASEPPLGLAYLGAVTRKMGIQTILLDACALRLSLEASLQSVIKEQPDFVGLTLATMSVGVASKLAEGIKNVLKRCTIIVGGPHLNALPQQTLQDNPSFDIGVVGEGERTLEELLRALESGRELSDIRGIVFRKENRVFVNSPRERIQDLDSLPFPAFDLLPQLNRYYRPTTQSILRLPSASLVTSRGCIGKCLFCDRKTFGNEIRLHSASYIVEMIERLQKVFGIKGIMFEEDNFMLFHKRLAEFAELMRKRRLKIAWSAQSRVDTINDEKLRLARSCGCWQILYGVESGSQKILDFLKKQVTNDQIEEAVRLTKKRGIYTKGFFMIGNPQESLKTLRETQEMIMRLPLDDVSVTFFTPYPGTDIWPSILQHGWLDGDWEDYTCFNPVFIPFGLTKEILVKAQKGIWQSFYSRPRIIVSYVRRLRSFSLLREFYRSWHSLSEYVRPSAIRKTLIVTAEDFGLNSGINQGIERLIMKGMIRGVSLVSTGEAFFEATKIAKNAPMLEVGVHLCLLETEPTLDGQEVSTLLGKTGRFENKFIRFLLRYMSGRIRTEHIRRELTAQIEKVRQEGFEITYLNGHQHIHMLPGIFQMTIELAKEYDIPFVRLPLVPLDSRFFFKKVLWRRKLGQLALNFLSSIYRKKLEKNGLFYSDYSYGFMESGLLSLEHLKDIFLSLRQGQSELFCHPAEENKSLQRRFGHWKYHWQEESQVLDSEEVKQMIDSFKIRLSTFRQNEPQNQNPDMILMDV
ncbi:MAG: hypothetical protein AMJ95_12565 [Omnitrophica WOR_2 bacterium SM23_72]|nr:MAG: hypothetical protein AMJ95_12565 [Omnitrophica WOR_2 bacterium SM23_72]